MHGQDTTANSKCGSAYKHSYVKLMMRADRNTTMCRLVNIYIYIYIYILILILILILKLKLILILTLILVVCVCVKLLFLRIVSVVSRLN